MRPSTRVLLAGLAGLLVALPFATIPTAVEYPLFDLRMALVSQAHAADDASRETAIVLMDVASEQALGVAQGPEWRRFHPALIRTLVQAGARVIAFDAEFAAASPWDAELGAACREAGNVVAGEISPEGTLAALAPSFAAIGDLTFGAAGGSPRWIDLPSRPRARLPLSATVVDLYTSPDVVSRDAGRMYVNYDFPISAIPAFSYVDVLEAADGRLADGNGTPLSVFQDRIVLIGKDMPWEGDRFAYPHTPGRAYPGVYGQLYATQTLLRKSAVRKMPGWADLAVVAVTCAMTSFLLLIRNRLWRILAVSALPVALFALSTALLAQPHVWFGYAGVIASFAGVVATHWVLRRLWLSTHLRKAMGFRPELIERFRAESRRSGGMVQKHAAILCSDIRGYTRFVADHPPQTVARVLVAYVGAMEKAVTSRGGDVNKDVGDEIIAVFGFPLAPEEAERRAVEVALAMLAALERLKAVWKAEGSPGIGAIGIGIDAGTLTFAEVGGAAKTQFDIIGNPINGAARLQAFTKEIGKPLVISAECHAALTGPGLADHFEPVGQVSIRGQGERALFAVRR
jgi:class 3 adenylate cyclase/CHASE2 domain-containing sensor protein